MWSNIVSTLCLIHNLNLIRADFDQIFQYKQISYANLPADKLSNPNYFIAQNNIPFGLAYHKGYLYVGCPRRRNGVPSTINRIDLSLKNFNMSPPLEAYPDYELNDIITTGKSNDQRIVSVYRPAVDSCGRLWFVDTGVLDYPTGPIVVQPASIWVIDLETNIVIRRFEIPAAMISFAKGLASVTVDVDTCENTFAYITDSFSFSLIAYSFSANQTWQFKHNFFYLDPLHGTFDISDQKFMWKDGIFSIALSEKNQNGFKTAFFHSSCSLNEFSVSTEVLKNQSLSSRTFHGNDFQLFGTYWGEHQSNSHVIDTTTGVVFLNQFQKYGVGCYNLHRPSNKKIIRTSFVHHDEDKMVYPSHLSIDENRNLWLLTNNVPKFFYATLDPNDYNFRIWKISVSDAIREDEVGVPELIWSPTIDHPMCKEGFNACKNHSKSTTYSKCLIVIDIEMQRF